jgi:hypothetical protein
MNIAITAYKKNCNNRPRLSFKQKSCGDPDNHVQQEEIIVFCEELRMSFHIIILTAATTCCTS